MTTSTASSKELVPGYEIIDDIEGADAVRAYVARHASTGVPEIVIVLPPWVARHVATVGSEAKILRSGLDETGCIAVAFEPLDAHDLPRARDAASNVALPRPGLTLVLPPVPTAKPKRPAACAPRPATPRIERSAAPRRPQLNERARPARARIKVTAVEVATSVMVGILVGLVPVLTVALFRGHGSAAEPQGLVAPSDDRQPVAPTAPSTARRQDSAAAAVPVTEVPAPPGEGTQSLRPHR